jgi:hypothetical protein
MIPLPTFEDVRLAVWEGRFPDADRMLQVLSRENSSESAFMWGMLAVIASSKIALLAVIDDVIDAEKNESE